MEGLVLVLRWSLSLVAAVSCGQGFGLMRVYGGFLVGLFFEACGGGFCGRVVVGGCGRPGGGVKVVVGCGRPGGGVKVVEGGKMPG